ncbi:hypothetical protein Rhe02_57200 [Rhizocola hellebori]|uniref:Uncharacterized protein n=1 Tax=Rhizocola hellebori TaxID=1392758 RepID=A0A8J3QB86_9ACTN|nr:DUF6412 domain-containing protein [Rhizocola hellebori]GIH07653.1 hypothetical protein Rhe02_57200 [Rhizocola hellebori]
MLLLQLRRTGLLALFALLVTIGPSMAGGGFAGVVALTVAAVCVAVALSRVALSDIAAADGGSIRREGAAGVLYLRHAHPDAAGHPRPRAPGIA